MAQRAVGATIERGSARTVAPSQPGISSFFSLTEGDPYRLQRTFADTITDEASLVTDRNIVAID